MYSRIGFVACFVRHRVLLCVGSLGIAPGISGIKKPASAGSDIDSTAAPCDRNTFSVMTRQI